MWFTLKKCDLHWKIKWWFTWKNGKMIIYLEQIQKHDDLPGKKLETHNDWPGKTCNLPWFTHSEKWQILAVWLKHHYGFGGDTSQDSFCFDEIDHCDLHLDLDDFNLHVWLNLPISSRFLPWNRWNVLPWAAKIWLRRRGAKRISRISGFGGVLVPSSIKNCDFMGYSMYLGKL